MIRSLDPVADRDAWLHAWQATGREPFAHPDYVGLFAEEQDTILAVLDEQAGGTVLLPLVRRPLPAALGAGADAVSPYGYGGPFASGDPDWRQFYSSLLAWMAEAGIVSAFVRASLEHEVPSLDDLPGYVALHLADNVRVDLARPDEEQWRHVAHKVRKSVNKARRAELSVRISEGFTDLVSFLEVYSSTMKRREAAARYHFDEAFFAAVGALPGCALVADVLDPEGQVVSTELVLVSDAHYYSFLGGTLQEAFVHAPNDLLKYAVIEHGHAAGRSHYVLGGGYETGDGIYRYKKGFDPDGVVPFFGIQLIADPGAYAALVAKADELRAPAADDGLATESYFPAYRRP